MTPGNSPRSGFRTMTVVSTGGARLHTEIHGPDGAPTVVLVHGWTCRIAFWHPVLDELAADHRVVVYDLRGHGRTPPTPGACGTKALADDLCAVLDATVPAGERAVVCGHSMGGMAVMAAADRPGLYARARAAVFCSTGADRLVPDSTVIPLRAGALRSALQRRLLRTRLPYGPVTPLSQRLVAAIALGPGAPPRLRARTARIVQSAPRRARAEWGAVLARLDLADRLGRLTLPVTLVHGEADRLTPPVHLERLASRLPEVTQTVLVPGAGHMTPLENPGAVAAAIRAQAAAGRRGPGRSPAGGTTEERDPA
ncbi:alpha/beta hydrolase [Streptomyces sp. 7-21]|uniref:alpha/beta fold hydrolase n=1 Tax=Streptomyces sp. 7-21 TaxID=2802283 RepID=UPI0027DCD9CB|nr:alpha/beta hydrolase [Streptomyces sp. 7-21]